MAADHRGLSWGGLRLLGLAVALAVVVGCGGEADRGEQTPAPAAAGGGEGPSPEPQPPAAGGQTPASQPQAQQPPPPASRLPFPLDQPLASRGFTVRWASWGTEDGSQSTDVTQRVREMIAQDGSVQWSPDVFNAVAGDPAPDADKWLVMVVDTPTRSLRIGLADHSNVYFTVPPSRLSPHGGGFQWTDEEAARATQMLGPTGYEGTGVVWARWGNDGRGGGWADATIPVAIQVTETDRIVNKTHNIGVPARSRHQRKTLRMLLSIDGQPLDLHLRKYSYIIDEPTDEHLTRP